MVAEDRKSTIKIERRGWKRVDGSLGGWMVLEGRNGSRVAFDVARTKLKSGSETRGGKKMNGSTTS